MKFRNKVVNPAAFSDSGAPTTGLVTPAASGGVPPGYSTICAWSGVTGVTAWGGSGFTHSAESLTTHRPCSTTAGGTFLPHAGDPATLLSLATLFYGRAAEAWLVQIPAVEFDPGRPFSEATQRGTAVALERIRELLA